MLITQIKKIPYSEFLSFKIHYLRGQRTLRFGQAFLNHFFKNVSDPDLYYAEDNKVIERIIYQNYLDNSL